MFFPQTSQRGSLELLCRLSAYGVIDSFERADFCNDFIRVAGYFRNE